MRGRWLAAREVGIAGVLALEIAVFAWLLRRPGEPNAFLAPTQLLLMLKDTAILGLAAIGTTIVIVSGGIDLSVGSVIALVSLVVAGALTHGVPVPLAVGAGLLVGTGCGLVSAAIITGFSLPPFIVTLGMMSIARGAAFLLTGGMTISVEDCWYTRRVGGDLLGLPVPALVLVACAALAAVAMSRGRAGRAIVALGGNEEAARLSGLRLGRLKALVYALGGLTAGLAGAMFVAQYGTGQSTAAAGWELDAIASAVLGGASLSGGRGSVGGTCLGAMVFQVLRSGLTMNNASQYSQVITGAVVIAVVVLDQAAGARAARLQGLGRG